MDYKIGQNAKSMKTTYCNENTSRIILLKNKSYIIIDKSDHGIYIMDEEGDKHHFTYDYILRKKLFNPILDERKRKLNKIW
jgi:hypothetical protein